MSYLLCTKNYDYFIQGQKYPTFQTEEKSGVLIADKDCKYRFMSKEFIKKYFKRKAFKEHSAKRKNNRTDEP